MAEQRKGAESAQFDHLRQDNNISVEGWSSEAGLSLEMLGNRGGAKELKKGAGSLRMKLLLRKSGLAQPIQL